MASMPDEFEEHARAELAEEPELLAELLRLRASTQQAALVDLASAAPPSAAALNARNQYWIDRAATLLGRERFEAVFGFPPGQNVNLVIADPAGHRESGSSR